MPGPPTRSTTCMAVPWSLFTCTAYRPNAGTANIASWVPVAGKIVLSNVGPVLDTGGTVVMAFRAETRA